MVKLNPAGSVFVLSSDAALLKQDRTDDIIQSARAQYPDAVLMIFTDTDFRTGGAVNLTPLENELMDPGLFGGDRILKIYLKDLDKVAIEVLLTLARYLRPGVTAIVDLPRITAAIAKTAPRQLPQELRKKKQCSKNDAIAYIKGAGGSVELFYPPDSQNLSRWIAERAQRKHGLMISPAACEYLASLNEGNLSTLDQSLALMAMSGFQGRAELEDVAAYFVQDSRFSAFELADALIGGDGIRALNILNAIAQAPSGGLASQLPVVISRLDLYLGVVMQLREKRVRSEREGMPIFTAARLNAFVKAKTACLKAASQMPEHLLTFLRSSLMQCAFLHSRFKNEQALLLLQTMAISVNHFGASLYAL